MKKRTSVFVILILIIAVMLITCNKSEEIICGNCSAIIPNGSQFCPSCGAAAFQNSTTAPTEMTETDTTPEVTENTTENNSQITETVSTQSTQPVQPTQPAQSTNAHTHNYSSATCTAPKTCSCGATSGSALGHSWSNATCTSPQKCSRCGMTTGSAASHSYTTKTTAATCTAQGYTTYTCSACGDSYKDNYVSAKHNYQNYKCTSCGAIDKDHAYEYLTNWVLENGEPSGAYTYVDYYSGNMCFSFAYSANYDYTFASLSFSSEGQFFYTDIAFDNYDFYTSFDDNKVLGSLNAGTFQPNSPIPYSSYTGDESEKYDMIDLSRTAVCDILDWAKWYLVEYNVGITLADLGFTAY